MNILLTEIRSLNLDLSGLPEVAPETASSFARLFQQQLPENPGSGNQVIDYKRIYAEFEIPVGAPAEALEIPQAAAWREYLAQDPVQVSSDSDPLQATAVNLELTALPAAAQALQPAAMVLSPIGELLPRGGKTLPDAGLATTVPGSVQVPPGLATISPTQVPAPQVKLPNAQVLSAKSDFTVPAGSPGVAVAELPPEILQQATTPANPGNEARMLASRMVSEKPTNTAIAAAISPAKPTLDSGTDRAIDAQPLPRADLRQPPVPNREPGATAAQPLPMQPGPAVDMRSTLAPLAAVSQSASASDPGQFDHQNRVNPDLPTARAAGPAENFAERAGLNPERWSAATRSAAEIQAGRTPAVAAEVTPAGELRATPGIQLNQAPQPLEQSLTQNTAVRAAEPTLNPSAPTAPAAAVAAPVSVTPLTAAQVMPVPGETLPPQLEVLQLSRQADGNDWGKGIGERVQWMINQKQNSAMIRLDPPALGKLDVQVKIADDSTTITIQTQHAQTRDLIETASHRLRDFLQESGYQNVNVDVSHRHDQQQARAQTGAGAGDESTSETDAEQDIDDSRMEQGHGYLQGDGLLDTFA